MRNQKGQALVEYILIVALMSIIIISVVKFLGGYIRDSLTKTSCGMAGLEYIKGDKPGQGSCSDEEKDSILEDSDEDEEETEEDE